MPAPRFADVCQEYDDLFASCIITKPDAVQAVVDPILQAQGRYENVARTSGVPWFVIAVIHSLECDLDFGAHLHNGDSLKRKTFNVPAGRPPGWDGSGTWEESALDALGFDGLTAWSDWSLAGICYMLEGYNGWGSRAKGIHTPYLWSLTNHYTCGKFVADHVWSDSAVSKQCGGAAVLRRLAEMDRIDFGRRRRRKRIAALPPIRFCNSKPANPADLSAAKSVQQWLNSFPGIFVSVDGFPGPKTSDKFKLITGHYLFGDPREKKPLKRSSGTKKRRKKSRRAFANWI